MDILHRLCDTAVPCPTLLLKQPSAGHYDRTTLWLAVLWCWLDCVRYPLKPSPLPDGWNRMLQNRWRDFCQCTTFDSFFTLTFAYRFEWRAQLWHDHRNCEQLSANSWPCFSYWAIYKLLLTVTARSYIDFSYLMNVSQTYWQWCSGVSLSARHYC
jgi:hypothetical protein